MTSEITYTGDLRCEATHIQSKTIIHTDAPVDNRGKGESFSPTDLMATSLGGCIMTIIGIAAQDHGLDVKGMKAEVTKIMSASPRRIGEIKVAIHFPQNYSDKDKQMLQNYGLACPVSKSIHPDIKQDISFHYPEQ